MHRILIPFAILFAIMEVRGQGCSDAGVCTAGPIGALSNAADPNAPTPEYRHSARLTFSYAIGERNVIIFQALPQIDLGLGKRFGLQLKMPYISTSGDLGSNAGIGDPVISGSYAIIAHDQRRLAGVAGIKVPVNNANAQQDGKPLPMPYQTSLGTTDLLLGLNYHWKRWQAAVAYQHVLDQSNSNGFTHDRWMDDMRALGYFKSFHLSRANDAVLRLQYKFPVGRLAVQPGLLAIQHLGKDQRFPDIDERATQLHGLVPITIDGSEGLTLNITLDAQYPLAEQWAMLFAFGSPVITRAARPDGLTRSMVMNVSLMHRFGRSK